MEAMIDLKCFFIIILLLCTLTVEGRRALKYPGSDTGERMKPDVELPELVRDVSFDPTKFGKLRFSSIAVTLD